MPRGRPKREIDPALLQSGRPAGQIADEIGCSTGAVLARQREQGIPVRGRGDRGRDRVMRKPGSGIRPPEPLPEAIRRLEPGSLPSWLTEGVRRLS